MIDPETLARVRDLVEAEPGIGRPRIVERLELSHDVVIEALRELGYRGQAGRPPGPAGPRTRKVFAAVSDSELEELREAAGEQSVSSWLRDLALREARRT